MSTPRGLRMLRALEAYKQTAQHRARWDAANVFRKMTLVTAGQGRLRGHFTVEPEMCNAGDYMHGGFVASLVDTVAVFGYVSHPHGRVAWTTNLELHYIGAARLGELVEVETAPLLVHRRGGVLECTLRGAAGELLARGVVSLATPGEGAAGAAFTRAVTDNLRFDFQDES